MLEVMAVSSNSNTLKDSMDMVKKIVDLETKLIRVSAEPSQARDVAVSIIKFLEKKPCFAHVSFT
jgi:hypothetical protein